MPVKIILKEDVDSLGKAGELVNVRPGYARNFLLPNGLAVVATLQNLTWLKEHRAKLEQEANEKRKTYQDQKALLESLGEIQLKVAVGPTGQLFGRITTQVLAEEIKKLSDNKLVLAHKNISIKDRPHGIDELGNYTAIVNFGSGIKGQISLIIVEG